MKLITKVKEYTERALIALHIIRFVKIVLPKNTTIVDMIGAVETTKYTRLIIEIPNGVYHEQAIKMKSYVDLRGSESLSMLIHKGEGSFITFDNAHASIKNFTIESKGNIIDIKNGGHLTLHNCHLQTDTNCIVVKPKKRKK